MSKKSLSSLVAILLVVILTGCSTIHSFTTASFNVRYDNKGDAEKGNGWQQRYPVITELIRYNDFEIFGAQEVLHNMLEDLLANLPGYAYIGVGRDDG